MQKDIVGGAMGMLKAMAIAFAKEGRDKDTMAELEQLSAVKNSRGKNRHTPRSRYQSSCHDIPNPAGTKILKKIAAGTCTFRHGEH